jgi:predicted transcriptional regulator
LAPGLLENTRVDKFEGQKENYLDLAYLYEKSTFTECGKNRDKPIKPLMRTIDFSLPADTHILKALVLMSSRNDFNIPVTDNGTIVGVLRLEEIFMAMCNTYCPLP